MRKRKWRWCVVCNKGAGVKVFVDAKKPYNLQGWEFQSWENGGYQRYICIGQFCVVTGLSEKALPTDWPFKVEFNCKLLEGK